MSDQPQEIGRVLRSDGTTYAILRDDRTWQCPGNDSLVPALTALYANAYYGPSHGPYGMLILLELAATIGGTMKRPGPEPETVRRVNDHYGLNLPTEKPDATADRRLLY